MRCSAAIILIVSAFVANASEVDRAKLRTWASYFDGLKYQKELDAEPAERLNSLRFMANAVSHGQRLNAALCARPSVTEEAAILKALLDDTAATVRRAAARSLFGSSAEQVASASRYKYEDVLAVEQQTRVLFAGMPAQSGPDQYAATRRIHELGFNAELAVREALADENFVVVLSALSLCQAPIKNIDPSWLDELHKKLRKEISVDFVDTPVSEAVKFISDITGAKISLVAKQKGDFTFTFKFKNMPAEDALTWIARLTESSVGFRNGEFQVKEAENIVCGSQSIWLKDIRDKASDEDRKDAQRIVARVNAMYSADPVGTSVCISNGFIIAEMLPIGMNGAYFEKNFESETEKNP